MTVNGVAVVGGVGLGVQRDGRLRWLVWGGHGYGELAFGDTCIPTPPRRALTYPINHGTGKSPAVSDFPLREGRGKGSAGAVGRPYSDERNLLARPQVSHGAVGGAPSQWGRVDPE